MFSFTQHDGQILSLDARPERIVSLVPSMTELLIQMGAPVVGRTSFCIEPSEAVAQIPVVGGTKTPRLDKIRSLSADLIIANKEENTQEHVEALIRDGLKVWVSYPTQVEDVFHLCQQAAQLTPTPLQAQNLLQTLQRDYKAWKRRVPTQGRRAIILIWKDPWMGVGANTYTGHLLENAGHEHLLASHLGRYPVLSPQALVALRPDIVFLPSEPYAFGDQDEAELGVLFRDAGQLPVFQRVCGEDVTWPGLRLVRGLEAFAQ